MNATARAGNSARATSHSARSPGRQPPSSSSDSTVDSKARSFVWVLMGSYAAVTATGSGAASRTSILPVTAAVMRAVRYS